MTFCNTLVDRIFTTSYDELLNFDFVCICSDPTQYFVQFRYSLFSLAQEHTILLNSLLLGLVWTQIVWTWISGGISP
jgi:hypothetical protein